MRRQHYYANELITDETKRWKYEISVICVENNIKQFCGFFS